MADQSMWDEIKAKVGGGTSSGGSMMQGFKPPKSKPIPNAPIDNRPLNQRITPIPSFQHQSVDENGNPVDSSGNIQKPTNL